MNKPALLIIDMVNDSFLSEQLAAKRVELCDSINKLLSFRAREPISHYLGSARVQGGFKRCFP